MQAGQARVVDVIYKLATPIHMPDLNPLSHFKKVYETDPENSGINAVIGATRLVERLVGVITKVMGGSGRFKFVSNMEEALAAIEQARAERVA